MNFKYCQFNSLQSLTFLLVLGALVKDSVSSEGKVELNKDLILTQKQKLVLDKFRERVAAKLPHDYMRQDIYLVKWLRARKFNLEAAERMLMETLEWRAKNKIDTILEEDWSDMESEYRYSVEGCDNEGRPVMSVPLGDWDMRKAVVAGKSERLKRYMDKQMEEATSLVRASQTKGHNITQFSVILDLSNYNLIQQGCPLCVPISLYYLQTTQTHYTGSLHRLTGINMPQVFQPVLNVVRPLMSERAREIVSFYGKDKSEWEPVLLKETKKDKLTKAYGGTKEFPYEMEHFKEVGYYDCSSSLSS